MEITVARYAGFCFGVERAVNTAYETAEKNKGKKLFLIGELIHNPQITEELAARGAEVIEENELDRVLEENCENAVFVIRAHGVRRSVIDKINARGGAVVDCTCHFVAKIHRIVEQNTGDGTFTLLFGTQGHPEIDGIVSRIKGEYFIFDSFEKLKSAYDEGKLNSIVSKQCIMVSQTTQNQKEYKKSQEYFKNLCTKGKI